MTSLRHNDADPPRRALPRRRPRLHPRRRLAAYDAHRGRPPGRRLPDDDLPHLAGHADAARRPDDPRVGRGRARAVARADATATSADRADRIVGEVVGTTRALRDNELFVRIVELDPELLLPYLLSRRGRSPGGHPRAHRRRGSREGQPDGSVRAGNPVAIARALLLAAHGFVLSRAHDGRRRGRRGRPRRASSSTSSGACRRADDPHPRRPGRRTRPRSTCSSSGSASPAPASPSTPSPAGLSVLAVDAHDLAFGTSRWSSQAGPRRPALPRQRPGRRGPRERGRARHPDGGHRPPPDPRAADAATRSTRPPCRRRPRYPRAGHAAPATCSAWPRGPRRETLPRPRRISATETLTWRRSLRRDGLRGGHAVAGTASSRTTPGWSPRSRAPPPPTAPHVRTRARVVERHGAQCRAPRRADRRDRTTSARARSSTPPASGRATWSTEVELRPSRGTHLVLRGRDAARAAGRRDRAGPRREQPLRLRRSPSRTAWSTSASPTSRSTATVPDVPEPSEAEIGFLLDVGRRPRSRARCTAPTSSGRTPGCARCSRRRRPHRRPVPPARRADLARPAW